jgi:hypothetical protein
MDTDMDTDICMDTDMGMDTDMDTDLIRTWNIEMGMDKDMEFNDLDTGQSMYKKLRASVR